jgi:hypothetical protein
MTATRKRNVVTLAPVSATEARPFYSDWRSVPGSLRSSGMWRGEGIGIKKGSTPKAYFDPDDALNPERLIGLYDNAQTYVMKEPKKSKWLLLNRFVRRNEIFGLRPAGSDHPIYRSTNFLYGSVADLVYKSFDYKHRHRGIPTRFLFQDKQIHAEAFYVLSPPYTDWLVIDVDNHEPSKTSTKTHLLLVQRLVKAMPEIVKRLGGGSVFYDYAQESPRGIHIWVTLNRKRAVKPLHEHVRAMLTRMADRELDAELVKHGLKTMGSLEILPTERQLIRMFGGWDRRVFTTTELNPKSEGFDAEGLVAHIGAKTTHGNPCVRYAQLAIAGLGANLHEPALSVSVPPMLVSLATSAPKTRSGYMSTIFDACLNGVTEGDSLFDVYLAPLAQALYWREFHDQPDRSRLTNDALVRWINKKHNGMVSRINKGKRKLVLEQIRSVVKKLPETPVGIRDYWSKVVANDRSYPTQKVSMVGCIDAVVPTPVQVTKPLLKLLPGFLANESPIHPSSLKQDTYNVSSISTLSLLSLPPFIESRLREHLRQKKVRSGKSTERVVQFAYRLLVEIGTDGTRTIGESRMTALAGVGRGRNTLGRYKKLLRGAGILKRGWEKTYSKTQKRVARYDLSDWVLKEMRKEENGGADL